ncbi:ankyrin repeat domain-containing protein [Rickettsiales endosymbiont of Stachyamoeba lipophora]|uniref:ankyrin repeat domain-containing protein n=1 Tax=Rickettsiales endosymbiont of Stachyamoeba lipophora TaxID=2486578 RepID=UPI000F64FE5B|nr:ankyrin repeat domain-containing protein [Rickettsiales endosymbiont of Stachyamoeba lipophora]AZL16370.1 hypothetical protein EF513_07515 [Rickettsiales endosymbiont of Stachyamoeba lipophora]
MSSASSLAIAVSKSEDRIMADATAASSVEPSKIHLHREAQIYDIYTERSYEEFEYEYNINIKEASYKNLQREREFLGMLSSVEQQIITFIINNLTAKHKTHAFEEISKEGALLSVRERQRLERAVKNSHTGRTAGDDNIFFTVGLGDHKTPSFLSKGNGHTIVLSLDRLFKDYEHRFKGFYVSGHLSDYAQQTISRPSYFGETLFQYSHNDQQKIKTYSYTYPDGNKRTITLTMGDEIFCGREVLEGIALQFVRHIRLIGGNYYQHICDTIQTGDQQNIMQVLSTGMNLLMPGWIYPEGKLPGKLALDLPDMHLTVQPPKVFQERANIVPTDWATIDLKEKAYKGSDLELLKQLIANGKFTKTKLKESLFELAGRKDYQNRARTAQFLIDQGADLTAIDMGVEVLGKAVAEEDLEFIDILFTLKSPDQHDHLIFHKVNIQLTTGGLEELGVIGEACFGKKPEVLRRLIAHGADLFREPRLLAFAADTRFGNHGEEGIQRRSVETFKILLDHGVDIKIEHKYGKTPLMHFIFNGNIAGIIEAVNRGAPLDSQMSYMHISRLGEGPSYVSPDNGFTALHYLMATSEPIYNLRKGNENTMRYLIASSLLRRGANPNIRSLLGDTPYSLAVANGWSEIAELLVSYGADKNVTKDPYDLLCQHHQVGVVAVVKGIDAAGKEVAIMGKKLGKDGIIKQEYLFPGGLKDQGDKNLISAAIRELREETYGNLEFLVESNQVTPQVIYQYDTMGEDKDGYAVHYRVAYILFDIGSHLANMKLRARDDLHIVRLVPMETIQTIENQPLNLRNVTTVEEGRHTPLKGSNGLILEGIRQGKFSPQLITALNEISNIELIGKDLLMAAVMANDIEKVKYLLAHGVRVEPVEDFEKIPLQHAAYLGHFEIVKLLVENGADVNLVGKLQKETGVKEIDDTCWGSLSAAVLGEKKEIIEYLLPLTLQNKKLNKTEEENIKDITFILKDALEKAVKVNRVDDNTEIVQMILDTGLVTIDDHVWGVPLNHAATNGNLHMVNFLLSKGANINYCLKYDPDNAMGGARIIHSPLILAIENYNIEVALRLLQIPRIDVNGHRTCSKQGLREEIVNPLFAAIYYYQLEVAEAIIDNTDIDLAKRNNAEKNCLEYAAEKGLTGLAGKIAQKLLLNKIAEDITIDPKLIILSIRPDERGKPSIHIMHTDKAAIERLAAKTNSTLRQDEFTKHYYVRLGEVRLKAYLANGNEIYAAIVQADKERIGSRFNIGHSSDNLAKL